MRYVMPFMVVALLGLTSGPGIAADQTNTKDAQKSGQQKQDLTGGLGLTNRPSAGASGQLNGRTAKGRSSYAAFLELFASSSATLSK